MSVNVTTYHYDNARDGANTSETILTPENVNASSFGRIASLPVDGQIYGQPLIMTDVPMAYGEGVRNIVLVATENDSVYAFDAAGNDPSQGYLWKTSLLQPGETAISQTASYPNTSDITPLVGITGTPVIDPTTGTLYVVGAFETSTGAEQRIYALNISSGTNAIAPVVISATFAGTGDESTGGVEMFDAYRENQRPALTLANGEVYVAWSSHGDEDPWHGWVIAYNATTLNQDFVYNDTPNGAEGGIWMSGGGLAVDSSGNLYFSTGNGTFDADTGGGDYSMSLEKLSPSLAVEDYFTPYNQAPLSDNDLDYGCSDVVLLPTQAGANPDEMLSATKWGTIYLNDSDTGSLGEFNDNATGPNNDLAEVNITTNADASNLHNTISYWDGHVYVGGDGLPLQMYNVANGALSDCVSASGNTFGVTGNSDGQGCGPTISSNGDNDAIVWAVDNSGYRGQPAVLYAYNASNLSQTLYTSNQAAYVRDTAGVGVKFQDAVVANGYVYVGGAGTLTIYGLRTPSSATPTLVNSATANPVSVSGTTTALMVLATDPQGDVIPAYSWAATSLPSGAPTPTFSVNNSLTANCSTATFYQAGPYTFTATITDPSSDLAISSSVNVVVNQTLSGLSISPGGQITLTSNQTQQFTAATVDQFGQPLSPQPKFSWSVVSGGGAINSDGYYQAPASGNGSAIVQVSSLGYTAQASLQYTSAGIATFYPVSAGWYRAGVWQGISGTDGSATYSSPVGSTLLISKNPTSGGTLRDAYLLFNISNQTFAGDLINSVTLSLNAAALNQAGPNPLGVLSMTTTNWGAGLADPSPAPTFNGSSFIGSTQNVGQSQGSYATYNFSLGNVITADTNGLVSLELNSPNATPQETGIELDEVLSTPGVDPVITVNYTITRPGWLATGSAATWNSSSHILNVTGPTEIIGDPGSDEPIVQASGSSAVVTINPVAGLQVHLGGLCLANGSSAVVTSLGSMRSASNHRLLVIGAAGASTSPIFKIDASSQLDLTDNDLVIHDGNTTEVDGLLASGYRSGSWQGKGIISSNAALGNQFALGEAAATSGGSFDAEPVSSSDVEVRFTYYGDANLSGGVDGSDYSLIDNGYANRLSGWFNGDFNYDGVIDGSDYTLIDNAFNSQSSSVDAKLQSVVAEPAAATSPSFSVAPADTPAVELDARKHAAFSRRPIQLLETGSDGLCLDPLW
jgi:hypothetical protein